MEASRTLLLGDSLRDKSGRHSIWPGAFVFKLTLAAGISSLLAGYETSVTSSAIVSMGSSLTDRPLGLTASDKSIITSSAAFCGLFSTPVASMLADRLGRKRVMLYADVLFAVGSILQATSSTVPFVILGRGIIGAGSGAAGLAVSLYIAEVAPAAHRGMLVTTTILLVTIGQILGFTIASAFAAMAPGSSAGWRWSIGIGAVPAVLQATLLLIAMPDTPRWLVMAGRLPAAKSVLLRIQDDEEDADALLRDILAEVRKLREARAGATMPAQAVAGRQPLASFEWLGVWRELFREGPHRRALTIACLLNALQQMCGFNSLMYFSATVFMMVGFTNPSIASLVIAATNFLCTLLALRLIDHVGRRRMLLRSIPFTMLGLLAAAFGFSFLDVNVSSPPLAPGAPEASPHPFAALFVFASIIFFVGAFALGLGNVPALQSELYPLAARSLGTGIATAVSGCGTFIVSLTFLPLMELLGPSATLMLYASICGLGWVFIWHMYPETAGLSLEEASAVLERDWARTW